MSAYEFVPEIEEMSVVDLVALTYYVLFAVVASATLALVL